MPNQPSLTKAIIKAGLVAGTLDITAACLNTYLRSGKPPSAVFRYIASALFGKAAFSGGTVTIITGLLFHYLIAFGFTILFFLIYPALQRWLSRYIILTGMVYGMVVWCIMNLIIVPLTAAPKLPPDNLQLLLGMAFLVFFIGIPIAIFARQYYSRINTSDK